MAEIEAQEYVKRSIQIPDSVDRLWSAAARKTGLNKTAALIVALRQYAKSEGLDLEEEARTHG